MDSNELDGLKEKFDAELQSLCDKYGIRLYISWDGELSAIVGERPDDVFVVGGGQEVKG